MKFKKFFLLFLTSTSLMLSACFRGSTPKVPEHIHTFNGDWEVNEEEHWKVCDGGDGEIGQKVKHSFVSKGVSEPTCSHVATEKFECSVCGYSYMVDVGHEYAEHNYSVAITKKATCVEKGVYTFTCSVCKQSYTQEYEDADAHELGEGVKVGNVTTYKCKHFATCGYSKTTIDLKEEVQATVSGEDLKAAGDITLKNASIAFEESALEGLGDNISVAAETKTVEEVANISESAKAAIGNATIVDFSLKDGDEVVTSFNGTLTISIPYTLKANEDPNGIVVWYINEQGETEAIKAIYRDGNAVFETTHFSIYAVLHMSPTDLCKNFGHNMLKAAVVESTCKSHGYEDYVCVRCGESHRDVLPLSTHNYLLSEKKDSTVAAEGYVEYKCSVCGDTYRTIIEKKSGEQRNFYINLFTSLASADLYVSGKESMGEQEVSLDAYLGTDAEGLPFAYANAGGYISAVYKNNTYFSGLQKSELNSASSIPFFIKGNIEDIVDAIPASVTAQVDKIVPWLEANIVSKKAIDEGFELSINKAKVVKLIDTFETKKLGEAIDLSFGEGSVDKILGLVQKAYTLKVSEFLAELEEEEGITAEAIFAAIKKIVKIVSPETELGELSDYLTEEIKQMTIKELLVMTPIGSMIPAAFDGEQGAKAMIEQFLQMKLMDIISMMSGQGSTSAQAAQPDYRNIHNDAAGEVETEQKVSYAKMVEAYLNSINFVIKTDSEGRFLNAVLGVEEMQISETTIVSMSINVQKGFDKEPILVAIKDLVDKCNVAENSFKVSANNFKWLEDAYKEQFEGLEFEYFEEYKNGPYYFDRDEDGQEVKKYYRALVSKGNVKYSFFDEDAYHQAMDEYYNSLTNSSPSIGEDGSYHEGNGEVLPKPVEDDFILEKQGKLIFILNDYSYYYAERNENGFGTKVAKDEYGITKSINSIINAAIFRYTEEKEGGTVEIDHRLYTGSNYYREDGLREYSFLYSFSTNKYSHTTGSFGYLNADVHNYKYQIVSQKEYVSNTGYDPTKDSYYAKSGSKLIYMRATCLDCGEIHYTYQPVNNSAYVHYSHVNSFSVLSDKMNDEALENYNLFTISAYYTGSGTFEYVPNVVRNMNLVKNSDGSVSLDLRDYYDGYEKFRQADGSYKAGNAAIDIEIKKTDSACTYQIVWSIKVNNEVLRSGTYSEHIFNEYTTVTTTSKIDECHTIVTFGNKCNDCGKTFYNYSTISESHKFVKDEKPVEIHEKTDIMPGYAIYREVCSVCGEEHYTCVYDWPCSHANLEYADGEWTCPDCGYSISGTEEEKPLALFEELFNEGISDDVRAFAIKAFGEKYPYSYDTFYNYSFYIAVLTDIEGEPVPFAQYNLYPEYLYFDVHYEDHGFEAYRVFYLPVSQYEFEGLLNQAQNNYVERYEGEDIDSVNFYYAIIVLSNSGQATSFMFILD